MSVFHLGVKYTPTKEEGKLNKKIAGAIAIVANLISKNYGLNIYDSDQIIWDCESRFADNIRFINEHGVCLCEIRKA